MPENRCLACGHPEQGHGTRYAAIYGDHTWIGPLGIRPLPMREAAAASQRPLADAAPVDPAPDTKQAPTPAEAPPAAAPGEEHGRAPGAFARFLRTLRGRA